MTTDLIMRVNVRTITITTMVCTGIGLARTQADYRLHSFFLERGALIASSMIYACATFGLLVFSPGYTALGIVNCRLQLLFVACGHLLRRRPLLGRRRSPLV